MARAWLAAVAAVAALASGATAAPRPCVDPRGDVRLTEAGPVVDVPHLDLRYADLRVGGGFVVVVIGTYGMGGAGAEGVWKANFTIGKTRYYAIASNTAVMHPLDAESGRWFRGGVVGGPLVLGYGEFDATIKEIRILLPVQWFGRYAPRPGSRPSAFSVVSKQKLVTTGTTDVSLTDRNDCVKPR